MYFKILNFGDIRNDIIYNSSSICDIFIFLYFYFRKLMNYHFKDALRVILGMGSGLFLAYVIVSKFISKKFNIYLDNMFIGFIVSSYLFYSYVILFITWIDTHYNGKDE